KDSGRSFDCSLKRCHWRTLKLSLRGHVQDMGEIEIGKLERTDIPPMEADRGIVHDVRSQRSKCLGSTRQNDGLCTKPEFLVGPKETFEHPPAEEPRSSRDEQAAPTKILPEVAGVVQHMSEVLLRQWPRVTPRHRCEC